MVGVVLTKLAVTQAVVGTVVELSVDNGVEVLMSAALKRPETLVAIARLPI
jgi:hypothetical protein